VVVAGNYFGVGVDGASVSPYAPTRNPDLVQMRNNSSIRIGFQRRRVSDDLEGNRIYNMLGAHFVDASPRSRLLRGETPW